ncbi:MAG: GSCFA domain-containing protein [Bacteroidales bacterium]|nr:GSCFA domain-containing protein [Bacteroidales bacterium]
MDDFRTLVTVSPMISLTHADRIVTFGSCFADRLGNLLDQSGFSVEQNPFGVLYNPMSVVKGMERLWYGLSFTEEDLFEYQGYYGTFMHHSSFSGTDRAQVLDNIQRRARQASLALHGATCLVLTFGTAWVYALAETGRVVANCHKMPDYLFVRRRLDTAEIVEYYAEFLGQVFEEKPDLKVIMTVSPIRYLKDGAHENTLSKSVLHLAVEELCLRFPQLVYFPAYELLTDDLRDYRFYDDDLIHPSQAAVRYIWSHFGNFAFDKTTREIIQQLEQIHKAMEHRPFHPGDEAYLRFAQKNLAALSLLQHRCPELDLKKETAFFTAILT